MIIRALIRSQISQTLSTFTGKTSVKRKKNGQLKKTGTGRKVLFGLLFAYLAIVFIGMFLGMGYGMAVFFLDGSAGGITAYVSIFAMVAFVFCFVGSVFSTEKQLYEAPDNEMLLSMPVAPWAILFSRMISLYFINFVFSGLVLLPGGIMLFIYSKVTAMMVIGFLLALLLIPLLSLALTALIGGLVAFLASKLPFKTLVTTLLFALFFLAYMFFAMNMDVVIQVMAENGAQIASGIPPLNALGLACAGSALNGLYFVLWCLVPFFVVYFLLSKSFITIATANRGERKKKYVAREMNKSSALAALTRKELARLFSMPMYVLNSVLGTIFQIVVFVMLIVYKDSIFSALPEIEAMMSELPVSLDPHKIIVILLCLASCLCVSFNFVSAPSISIERDRIWQMKTMPVKAGDVLMAKLLCHMIVSLPMTVVFAVGMGLLFQLDPLEFIFLLITPLLLTASSAAFGLSCNLWLPKLDFPADINAIKQSGAIVLTMFGSMLLCWVPLFVFMGLGVALSSSAAFSAFTILYAIVTGAIFFSYIFIGGKNKFDHQIGMQ